MARILIVEDSDDIRLALVDTLRQTYNVLQAENGRDGLSALLQERPDVVLTDMVMPIMDGPTLIKQIQLVSPSTSIIGMSAGIRADQVEAERERLGIEGFLAKPFDMTTVRSTVHAVLQRQNSTSHEPTRTA